MRISKIHLFTALIVISTIGGITLENLPQVLAVGASRVAVGSGIIESDEICETTRKFLSSL